MDSEFEDDEFTDSDIESDGDDTEDLPSRLPLTCGLCRLDVDAEDNDGILECMLPSCQTLSASDPV